MLVKVEQMNNKIDENGFPIDFVVTWVDGSDEKWRRKLQQFQLNKTDMDNGDSRYREFGFFKYWFLGVAKYAPWVNRIWVVTDGQMPDLDLVNKYFPEFATKITVVDHKEIIPNQYLPTFNSNTIELNAYKINGLAEHFVLFNDDFFIANWVSPLDFFDSKGMPKDYGIMGIVQPSEEFQRIVLNDLIIINKKFNKKHFLKDNFFKVFSIKYGVRNIQSLLALPYWTITGFHNPHTPTSYLKQTFKEVYDEFPDLWEIQNQNKFRMENDVSHWLMRYWQLVNGKFSPRRYSKFGVLMRVNDDMNRIKKQFGNKKIVVLNDVELEAEEFNTIRERIENVLENKYIND